MLFSTGLDVDHDKQPFSWTPVWCCLKGGASLFLCLR
jgi:hypothetical protein